MKKLKLSILTFITSLLGGCTHAADATSPSGVDNSGASSAVSIPPVWQAIRDGALLVDTRSQREFDAGHLEGALLIPHHEVKHRVKEFGDDKARTIVVYCKSGGRSGMAKRMLQKLGYTAVINGGGYKALLRSKPE